jgi:ubiquinone/menaquinone biosynthesis C-methylase UbiE
MTTTLAPNRKRAYKGLGMEGAIARWYARNTAGRDHRKVAGRMVALVPAGGSILEVAPGPGYLAIELAKLGKYRVFGLDISQSFVQIATANARAARVEVEFQQGNAADMPFAADAFDLIVCQAAFKNFSEPARALAEMHRVLKPGAKALVLDLRPDASSQAIDAEIKNMDLSGFNSWITKQVFKHSLLKRAYSQEQFRQMASQTPFRSCEIETDSIGLAVSLVK